MFRALVRRAGDGDLEAVEVLASLSRSCAAATKEAADAAWKSGYSYTQLGDALGITRQAARQRFGSPADKPKLPPLHVPVHGAYLDRYAVGAPIDLPAEAD
jgi:hypothetical protein